MPPPVQYAKSGDLFIRENPYIVRFVERLSSFCRLIRFDKRGTGLSDRPTSPATLEERTDDIRAILDSAKSEGAHLFGVSEGGFMTMLFAATRSVG